MKAAEAIQKVGLILQDQYKTIGFKYKKSEKCLIRTSGDFSYLVIMYSTRGNKEGTDVSLNVDLKVDCDSVVNNMSITVGQLFYFRLSEQEQTIYNIATEPLIEEAIKDLSVKINAILLPFIDKLEGDLSKHEKEWVEHGFFGNRKGYKGYGLGFEVNLKFIASVYGKRKAEECLQNYLSTLMTTDRQVFIDTLTGKVTNENMNSKNYGMYSCAKELDLNLVF